MDTNQPKGDGTFKITGNWEEQSRQLKAKYSLLTDTDLKFETGKETELLTRVEARLNKKRNEVISLIREGQPKKA